VRTGRHCLAGGETGLGDPSGKAFAIDPSTPTILYARTFVDPGMGLFGLSKSLDGGATWQAADAGLDNHIVTTLVIDPLTSTTLYAGTFDNGVFRSLDGGATWQAVNTGLTHLGVNTLAVHPRTPPRSMRERRGCLRQPDSGGERPPRCDLGRAVPNLLWPPNHKLVPVRIAGVTDPEGSPVTITIIRVTQDEPVNGRRGWRHPPGRPAPGRQRPPTGGAERDRQRPRVPGRVHRGGRGRRSVLSWPTATSASASCTGGLGTGRRPRST
jgi:hypothetical protein